MDHHPKDLHFATLVCWCCGAKNENLATDRPIRFGVELAKLAELAGWIGAYDGYHSRILVLCSQRCFEAAKTKAGRFRMFPPKPLPDADGAQESNEAGG